MPGGKAPAGGQGVRYMPLDNRDIYGRYFVCTQCGYYLTDSEEARLVRSTGHGSPAGPIDSAKKTDTVTVGAV